MKKKYIIWQKVQKYMYKEVDYSDDTMDTLSIFLNDGLGYKPYIDFLKDKHKIQFHGNISFMEKQGKIVTVEIDDYVYPNMPPFTTTIDNLITILEEFRKLEELEADKIKISLENDLLTITSD